MVQFEASSGWGMENGRCVSTPQPTRGSGERRELPLSLVHTVDYSRRKRQQFVAYFGDYSRQCGRGFSSVWGRAPAENVFDAF